ncbi:hypothetical protein RhiirA4_429432, partial [Rhizophagus irregularis]
GNKPGYFSARKWRDNHESSDEIHGHSLHLHNLTFTKTLIGNSRSISGKTYFNLFDNASKRSHQEIPAHEMKMADETKEYYSGTESVNYDDDDGYVYSSESSSCDSSDNDDTVVDDIKSKSNMMFHRNNQVLKAAKLQLNDTVPDGVKNIQASYKECAGSNWQMETILILNISKKMQKGRDS